MTKPEFQFLGTSPHHRSDTNDYYPPSRYAVLIRTVDSPIGNASRPLSTLSTIYALQRIRALGLSTDQG